MDSAVHSSGQVFIELIHEDGSIEELAVQNLVVTAGLNWIASRLTAAPTAMSHMAVGTNSTTPVLGQTALTTEVSRVALTSSTTTGAATVYVATFAPGVGTGSITEAGIFNAASGGTMLARVTFAAQSKAATDTIKITWTITQS